MPKCFFLLYVLLIAIPTIVLGSQDAAVKRIYAHLLIGDHAIACNEAEQALRQFPDSPVLWRAYIKALGQKGDESAMLKAWEQYLKKVPADQDNSQVIEEMAWCVISKGANSSSLPVRVVALLGAFWGQDARGVSILATNLRDKNFLLREVALKLSGRLRDEKLRDEVLRILQEEKVWDVRLEVIRAIGSMKITEAKPTLLAILADNHVTAEEKAVAISSLVSLLDTANREEVERLAHSDRAGLRLLACQVVSHFLLERDADLMVHLLKDHHADVRAAALQVLGVLDRDQVIKEVEPLLSDPDPGVAITAAWYITLRDSTRAKTLFYPWLRNDAREVRIQGATALAATGNQGIPYVVEAFQESKDPYIRMNLALGMIRQREKTDQACDALYKP